MIHNVSSDADRIAHIRFWEERACMGGIVPPLNEPGLVIGGEGSAALLNPISYARGD